VRGAYAVSNKFYWKYILCCILLFSLLPVFMRPFISLSLLFCSILSGQSLLGQTSQHGQPFPRGVYMSFEAVDKRKPDFDCTLDVITRTRMEHNSRPGHLFRIERTDNCLTYKQAQKMVAYSSGERIYFRGSFIDQEYGFFESSYTGKYLPFFYTQGAPSDQDAILFAIALGGGLIPALIALAVVESIKEPGNAAENLPIYFFDLENKQTYPLNNMTFNALLRLYPELKAEYEAMDKTDIKVETYLDFLQRMH